MGKLDSSTMDGNLSLTADGVPVAHGRTYYYFDSEADVIADTDGMRRVDFHHFGFYDARIVEISQLRADRDDALADGQKFYQKAIERLRYKIADLECKKSIRNRSLKAFLTAGR